MTEITGYKPNQAQTEIRELDEDLSVIMSSFQHSSIEFLKGLEDNWYSPNAVEFGNKAQTIIEDFSKTYCDFHDNIIRRSVEAYNALARSNNEWMIGCPDVPRPLYEPIPFQEKDPNGVVGMNVDKVTTILDTYLDSFRSVGLNLDGLSTHISFFDPDGSILSAYQASIVKLKQTIEENVQMLQDTIQPHIAEEQEKIRNSVLGAASEMQ